MKITAVVLCATKKIKFLQWVSFTLWFSLLFLSGCGGLSQKSAVAVQQTGHTQAGPSSSGEQPSVGTEQDPAPTVTVQPTRPSRPGRPQNGVSMVVVSIDAAGHIISGGGQMSSNARYFSIGDSLRDTCLNGPADCVPTTIQFTNESRGSGIPTPDGKYVASSVYDDLHNIPGDLEFTTTCIGASDCSSSNQIVLSPSSEFIGMGSVSDDGRYISYATGIEDPATNLTEYLYDTCAGAAPECVQGTITLGSTNTNSVANTSSDGRHAVYTTLLNDGTGVVILRDTCLGASSSCVPEGHIISDTTKWCGEPFISPDAQFVTYSCSVNHPSQVVSYTSEVFIQRTCAGQSGACDTTASEITTADPASIYPQNSDSHGVSRGGRFVTYETQYPSLKNYWDANMVYVYDTCNGVAEPCTPGAAPLCVNAEGTLGDGHFCFGGQISEDGHYIFIDSDATNVAALPFGVGAASYIATNPLY